MMDWKERRFEVTGIEHMGRNHKEKHMLVYLTDNEDGSKTLSIENLDYAVEIPFDEIYEYCCYGDGDMCEEERLLARMHILKKQLKDYTSEDYLNEADELEKEMQKEEQRKKKEIHRLRAVRGPKLEEQ